MGSVGLVSAAQLGMRWGMVRLPSPSQWMQALWAGQIDIAAVALVCASILAYALSMLCWLIALRDLPLSRAYSMLSVSYVLVYALAALLPFFHETFTVPKTVGVTLIVMGVLTINRRRIPSVPLQPHLQPHLQANLQDNSHENQRFR
ncbi:4-amino-4-deoxy-L-arabinose-phosphoundecaprenol flippase subunit ArnF [Pseudomonas huanghezhanensis]|uniref:4-amino-4-deoxy-L-arabinose-phosphoundecaprenol flippase subunit ArnF n=1 Tax=Pseudomonas huanghezhanensis TaxID=3002903 RepID=UPI00228573A6|nr:4-amino-4-deoxy-L-arabinose-phosphoundecaprenol flippase subunit ArnF [Pseudomonas sp. BSw22131]